MMPNVGSQAPHTHPRASPLASTLGTAIMPSGSGTHRWYITLTVLALAGTAGFWARWPSPFNRQHPFLYGLTTLSIAYYLVVWFARWFSLRNMRRPIPIEAEPGLRVGVATSFVPAVEPRAMLEQTVRNLVALEYPHDTWVLDEGNDPEIQALCSRLGAIHFSRAGNTAYQAPSGPFAARTKHGNYNAWLDAVGYARYDVVATFDPDHVPERTYLTRLLGHFRDPVVGFVQAPQVYYNQPASFIARGAAEETYAYYSSHLMASYGLGHTIVIGSHTAHRVSALQSVGGFPPHDAEDLYLTMVYRASEWRGVYVPEILAMGLAPVDWSAYLRQQMRWSRAVVDLKRHAFTKLAGSLSLLEKALNLFHGTYYLRPVLVLAFFIVAVGMVVQNDGVRFLEWGPLTVLLGLAVLLSAIDRFRTRFFLDPKRESTFAWRGHLLQIAKAPHVAVAVLEGLRDKRVDYVTTTKLSTGKQPRALAPPHLALAMIMAAALGIGYGVHGPIQPSLVLIALGFMGVSLALAWTETRNFPPPFDPALLAERRRQMADLLAPAAPPVTEATAPGIR
jgi:hypothetical protein